MCCGLVGRHVREHLLSGLQILPQIAFFERRDRPKRL
jgi:hypothetical protein